MANLPILSEVINFIEENLQNNLTVQMMADRAGYSLYHFCRVFSKGTYHTPYDYLLRRRLTRAAGEVLSADKKILDIALEYQFESHEGFTRAFQRMFKLSPLQARKNGRVDSFDELPRLTISHLEYLQEQAGFIPEILFMPVLLLKGVMTRITSFARTEMEPVLPGVMAETRFRVVLLDQNKPAFLICADPEGSGLEEHQMDKTIPPGRYALFTHKGGLDSLNLAMDWILHCWLFYSSFELGKNWLILENRGDSLKIRVPLRSPEGK